MTGEPIEKEAFVIMFGNSMILESYSVVNDTKISVLSISTSWELTKLSINSSEVGVRGTHTTNHLISY